MILGSCMGDGSVEKPHGLRVNYLLSFHQNSLNEEQYIKFKHNLISTIYKTNPIRPGNNNTLRFSISTKEKEITSFVVTNTRNSKNERVFPNIELINPITILFWYLDDGSLSISEQKRGGRKSSICRKLRIHLQSYNNVDILDFLEKFNTKFGLSFKPFYEKIKGERKIVSIGISNNIREIVKFLDLINPYINKIPKCMRYKFCLCFVNTSIIKDQNLNKYNVCNFHETKFCKCRNKSLRHI